MIDARPASVPRCGEAAAFVPRHMAACFAAFDCRPISCCSPEVLATHGETVFGVGHRSLGTLRGTARCERPATACGDRPVSCCSPEVPVTRGETVFGVRPVRSAPSRAARCERPATACHITLKPGLAGSQGRYGISGKQQAGSKSAKWSIVLRLHCSCSAVPGTTAVEHRYRPRQTAPPPVSSIHTAATPATTPP